MNSRLLAVALSLSLLLIAGCENSDQIPAAAAQGTKILTTQEQLLDIEWQWLQTVTPIETIITMVPTSYTLVLRRGGRAEMRFDCNRGRGSYELQDNKLSFGPMSSTRMACPPDSQDAVYMNYLQRVTAFFMHDGMLYLELPAESGTMHFEPSVTKTHRPDHIADPNPAN
ncbi:MAG: META domain-containing protein [Pseudomonadota bacterium]